MKYCVSHRTPHRRARAYRCDCLHRRDGRGQEYRERTDLRAIGAPGSPPPFDAVENADDYMERAFQCFIERELCFRCKPDLALDRIDKLVDTSGGLASCLHRSGLAPSRNSRSGGAGSGQCARNEARRGGFRSRGGFTSKRSLANVWRRESSKYYQCYRLSRGCRAPGEFRGGAV